MINLIPLFSGSKGNSTLIQTNRQYVLLDVGFGFRATVAKLGQLGVDPRQISAVVITHEHSDHIGGLPCWTKYFHTPVFAPRACCNYIAGTSFCDVTSSDGSFQLGDLFVESYACSHDARETLGYRFSDDEISVASVTDTGETTPALVNFLRPCQKIILESNHDVAMLKNGDYPYQLKQRILSHYGHLSNVQAAEVLKAVVGGKVCKVLLAHLSEQNNTKELALSTAVSALSEAGVEVGKDICLFVADQRTNNVTL